MTYHYVRLQASSRPNGGMKTELLYWDGSNDAIEGNVDHAVCWFLQYRKGVLHIRTVDEHTVVIYYSI